MTHQTIRRCLLAGSAVAALSCDRGPVTAPVGADSASVTRPVPIGRAETAKLFTCPTRESFSGTSQIGPLGGVLSVEGASISIPAGALLSTSTVTLTVPSSNYIEIDVRIGGAEHFVFEQPVVITMSYARCSRNNILSTPVTAWYFDQKTGALLKAMPSVDDKLLRAVTFTTDHLSGYILAN